MTTQTKSRWLLTVLIGAALAPSFYWILGGYPLYGTLLLVGGIALLVWIWYPRAHAHRDE